MANRGNVPHNKKDNNMSKATITGFFNPRTAGDTFKGLNGSIDGAVAESIIPDLPTFLQKAGRDYYIQKAPVFQRFDGEFAEVENQYHLVRSNDQRVVSPHTVTGQYAPLSLVDIAEELQPWCDAGWCTPDGVYSGRNESLEILSLRLDAGDVELAENERFMHYIVFQNPHGSGGMAKGKIISWRIVCANTFAAAVSASADFTITHRVANGDHDVQKAIMAGRTKDAIAAWEKARGHIAKLSDKINAWQSVPLQFADAKNLTDRLVGITDESKASTRAKNKRDAILAAFSMPQFGTYGRNAYDWLNGVTFVNSSPLAEANKRSKVSGIDRTIRNLDMNGSGFAVENRAESLLAELMG